MTITTETTSKLHTSVILVVKGAGVQKQDDTLGVFVNGFWPALKNLKRDATIHQRHDIFPSDYLSSPHDTEPHNHITEIRTGNQRIWIKESYWEQDLRLSGVLTVLQREWHMATYAFGSSLFEFGRSIYELFRPRTLNPQKSPLFYLAAFLLMYLTILSWPLKIMLDKFLPVIPPDQIYWEYLGLLVLAAFLSAIPPTLETHWRLRDQNEITRLPAMANWVLLLLIATFLLNPLPYLHVLVGFALCQVALLVSRAILWSHRPFNDSDTNSKAYFSYREDRDSPSKFGRRESPLIRLGQTFYRYIVVLGLPITFPFLIVARLLKWTGLLKDIGNIIEATMNLVLGNVLGDVATYAMDPATAQQVRSVVETDLRFFHNYKDDKNEEVVSDIHVFAHSLGTPITFELLFNHLNLDADFRKKIKTYITIGSVLSYFNQTNPVLDLVFIRRFPVRDYPDNFAPGFKWVNFWNLIDPITEFYGLDEYPHVTSAPELPVKNQRRFFANWFGYTPTEQAINLKELGTLSLQQRQNVQFHGCSPINIKSYVTPANHSEYWSNINLIQRPFAKRILGDLQDKGDDLASGWPCEWIQTVTKPLSTTAYQVWLLILWGIFAFLFLGVVGGIFEQPYFFLPESLRQGLNGGAAALVAKFTEFSDDRAAIIKWLFVTVPEATRAQIGEWQNEGIEALKKEFPDFMNIVIGLLSPHVHTVASVVTLSTTVLLILLNFFSIFAKGIWNLLRKREA